MSYWTVKANRGSSDDTTLYETPNFFWPKDRSWCVGTGIDSRDTLVAANSRDIIERLASDSTIETIEVP